MCFLRVNTSQLKAIAFLLLASFLVGCDGYNAQLQDNNKPIAHAGNDKSILLGESVTLDATESSDQDNDPLTYQWSLKEKPQSSQLSMSDTSLVSLELTPDASGIYILQLIVNDGKINSSPDKVKIIVGQGNNAPKAQAGEDQQGFIGNKITLDGSKSSDVDGDLLHFIWEMVEQPEGSYVTLTKENTYKPSFTPNIAGKYLISLKVKDGNLTSDADQTEIIIYGSGVPTPHLNIKPVARIKTQTNAFKGATVVLDGSSSYDLDNDKLTFLWQLNEKPLNSQTVLINEATVTPSLIPDLSGKYTIQLQVNDGKDISSLTTISLLVSETEEPINHQPTAKAGENQTANLGESITLDGSTSFDPDEDQLSYQWSLSVKPGGSETTITHLDVAITSFTPDVAGEYVAQLIVNDGQVNSEPDQLIISVEEKDEAPNNPPVADAGEDQAVIEGDVVKFNGSGSHDPDGDLVKYEWTEGETTLSEFAVFTKNDLNIGSHEIMLTVTDNNDATHSDTTNIIINKKVVVPINTVPVANPQTVITKEDTEKQITLVGTDADGDTLTYHIVTQPSKGTLRGDAPNLVYKPKNNEHGAESFTFKVNDGQVGSEIALVTIDIKRESDTTPPVITLNGGDISITIGGVYTELGATATDERDGEVDVKITGLVDTNIANTYFITYSATDLAGNHATLNRSVMVFLSDNLPPVAEYQPQPRVNTFTENRQVRPKVSFLNDGGYVVIWGSSSYERYNAKRYKQRGVYFQRFNKNGQKVGDETMVNDKLGHFPAYDVVTLSDGSFIITWSPSSGEHYHNMIFANAIYFQHFTSDGIKIGANKKLNRSYYVYKDIIPLRSGGFALIWNSYYKGVSTGIKYQGFDRNGVESGAEILLDFLGRTRFRIVQLADNSFVAASYQPYRETNNVFAQRYDSDLNKIGSKIVVDNDIHKRKTVSAIASLNDGGYVIAWIASTIRRGDFGDIDPESGIFTQQFNKDNAKIGPVKKISYFMSIVVVSSDPLRGEVAISVLTDGSYIVTWAGILHWFIPKTIQESYHDYDGEGVYQQKFNPNGEKIGSVQLVNKITKNDQVSPDTTALNNGGHVVTWASYELDRQSPDVYLQQFDYANNEVFIGQNEFNLTVPSTIAGDLSYITDPDNDVLSYTVENNSSSFFTITETGDWNYTPPASFSGQDVINITIKDNKGGILKHTLIFNVDSDVVAPVITLSGESRVFIRHGTEYIDKGATAIDDRDGVVSVDISGLTVRNKKISSVNGRHVISYTAKDSSGNIAATVFRTVYVGQPLGRNLPPVITITIEDGGYFGSSIALLVGETYKEYGAIAQDDNDWVTDVVITGSVDINTPGIYIITYTATDSDGASSTKTRKVIVGPRDTTPPVITLNGGDELILIGDEYTEKGAKAIDDKDGEITVVISGSVDINKLGKYVLTYNAVDKSNNWAIKKERTVRVVTDNHQPNINYISSLQRVNTYVLNKQHDASVATLIDGSYIVVWASRNQTNSQFHLKSGVFLQRFDEYGNKVGVETQVNTDTASHSYDPSIASLNHGGYLIVWTNGESGIKLQKFSNNGIKVGAEILVNSDITQEDQADVTVLTNDGYAVIWHSPVDNHIYIQQFNEDNSEVFSVRQLDNLNMNGDRTTSPKLTSLKGGNYVATWGVNKPPFNNKEIYQQLFNSEGNKIGEEVTIHSDLIKNNSLQNMAPLNNGGYLIAWQSDSNTKGIYVQEFDQYGATVSTESLIDSGYKGYVDIAVSKNGAYTIVWQEIKTSEPSQWPPVPGQPEEELKYSKQLYFQRFTENGEKIESKTRVNPNSSEEQQDEQPRIATLKNGGFTVVWDYESIDNFDDLQKDVMQQQYNSNGEEARHYQTTYTLERSEVINGNLNYITDPDHDDLRYIATGLSEGTFTVTNDGNWQYAANNAYLGVEKVEIMVSDGRGGTLKQELTFHIKDIDTTPPVITINGNSEDTTWFESIYIDKGATALDNIDGNVTVESSGTVDTNKLGENFISYTAMDSSGNASIVKRKVTVIPKPTDTVPPVITINGGNETIPLGSSYVDQGATAHDDVDGDVTVTTTGIVDTTKAGAYTITYTAIDKAKNETTATRTVTIEEDNSDIVIYSPETNVTVKYNFITIEIENLITIPRIKNLSVNSSPIYLGLKDADDIFIYFYNVVLQEGGNVIEITGKNENGIAIRKVFTINSEGGGIPPVELEIDRTKAFSHLTTGTKVQHGDLKIFEYYIDRDGDRVADIINAGDIDIEFSAPGQYHTSVTVRTEEDILYSSNAAYSQTVNILENPEDQSTTLDGINATIYDLEEDANNIYALSANVLYKISKSNPAEKVEISLPALTTPQGFTFDSERNIFIADTGADRIVKLLASNNYQEDTTFVLNEGGSEDGQLLSPKDVTTSGKGKNLKLYVLDAGNNRVQAFDRKGDYLAQFDGSTTPDGKLNNPLNMIGGSSPVITDYGNNIIRELSYNSQTRKEQSNVITGMNNMSKMNETSQGYIVSNNNDKTILSISNQGDISQTIPMTKAISTAMVYDQNHQVIYQEQGATTLKHIFIPKTTAKNAPLALSKKFIQAYLDDDTQAMSGYVSPRLLNIFNEPEVKAKARVIFATLRGYRENVYMYGLKAVVEAKAQTTQGEISITFEYIWQKGRWILEMVR